jgi:hypothetical protein
MFIRKIFKKSRFEKKANLYASGSINDSESSKVDNILKTKIKRKIKKPTL